MLGPNFGAGASGRHRLENHREPLREFGRLERVREASIDDLARVVGRAAELKVLN